MAFAIDEKQLRGKPRKIGTWKNKPVMEAVTKGGYHLVLDHEGKPLGAGPHRCISRAVAERNAEGLKIEEISKADYMPREVYVHLLPKYEAVTARLRSA